MTQSCEVVAIVLGIVADAVAEYHVTVMVGIGRLGGEDPAHEAVDRIDVVQDLYGDGSGP